MAGVQSIERAFAILRALSVKAGGVTELADRVELPKSTVARLLNALESEGAIEQVSAGGEYRIGPAIETLAAGSGPGLNLIAAARPFLVELAAQTGESSGLDVLDDGWVQFVENVENDDHNVQVRDWTGESGPAHSLPAGIVILANCDDSIIDRYLQHELEPQTSNTITTRSGLRDRLTQAKSAGYAWGFEEFAVGINSVAAPVFGPEGVVGALRVHGPSYRFPNPDRTHDIGRVVAEAAARLSRALSGARSGHLSTSPGDDLVGTTGTTPMSS